MIDKDTYKRELIRMWDSLRDDKYKGKIRCDGVKCNKSCPLYHKDIIRSRCYIINAFEAIEAVEKWSREHQPKKFKVSKLEYDILKIYSDYYFYESELLMLLLKKGYFEGADEKTNITYYFRNCEVKKDV